MCKFIATIAAFGFTPDETNTNVCDNAAAVRRLFAPAGRDDGNVEMTLCEFATLDAYLTTLCDGATTTLRLTLDYLAVTVTVTPAP